MTHAGMADGGMPGSPRGRAARAPPRAPRLGLVYFYLVDPYVRYVTYLAAVCTVHVYTDTQDANLDGWPVKQR